MSAVIYEVRLSVDAEIRAAFLAWLTSHVEEMLSFEGFLSAKILDGDPTYPNEISVQYTLENSEVFTRYEAENAERMRAEGLERFPEGLSATRRLWTIRTIGSIHNR